MIKFDVTQLKAIIENKLEITDLKIGIIQLGEGMQQVDINELTEVYVNNSDNKDYNNSDFTFHERLELFNKFNGWIHFAGGLSCSIQNKVISGLKIRNRYIESVSNIKRDDIISTLGKPDVELIDDMAYGGFDYAIDNYILVYENKGINFLIDPNTDKLNEIDTNQYDVNKYSKR